MGINGLLKALSPLLIPINDAHHQTSSSSSSSCSKRNETNNHPKPRHNIRQFQNKTLAIDASSWLYKASYSISSRLVEAVEENRIDAVSERVLCQYMVKRCEELLTHAGIKRIYLVFDGERCPLKAMTNEDREAKRRVNLAEARRLMKLGLRDQAMEKYKLCIKVVPWMGQSVAKAVSQRWKEGGIIGNNKPKVMCIFSPYEADAQMVKLVVDGVADAVVTEDSDVLVYSAACNRSFPIVYKLDRDGGDCDVLSMDWLLCPCSSLPTSKDSPGGHDPNNIMMHHYPSLQRLLSSQLEGTETKPIESSRKKTAGSALLSHLMAFACRESRKKGSGARMFVQACVLSGCDYAPSQLSGVGIVTAFKVVKENAHREPDTRFLHVLKSFPKDKISMSVHSSNLSETLEENDSTDSLMKEYEELLAKSECVFYFHRVLDKHDQIVPLVKYLQPELQSDVEKSMESMQDYIPKTDRFQNQETFLGRLTLENDTSPSNYPLHQNTKQQTSQPMSMLTNTVQCANPYKKKKITPKAIKATTGNLFSIYAHEPSSTFTLESPPPSQKLPQKQMTCINDDESSNDELDDAILNTSMVSFPKTNEPKQNLSFISKISSLNPTDPNNNSSSKCDDKSVKSLMKSRYFFSQNSILSKATYSTPSISQSISNISPSSPKLIRTVTPSMAELQARDSCTNGHFKESLKDDNSSSSDDDDCIIIEEHSLERNLKSNHGNFISTFSQAQRQGTRAKVSSVQQQPSRNINNNNNNKRRNSSKALGSCTKKAKSNLITGFFAPVTNSQP
jgi:5'-3' exonuclease